MNQFFFKNYMTNEQVQKYTNLFFPKQPEYQRTILNYCGQK